MPHVCRSISIWRDVNDSSAEGWRSAEPYRSRKRIVMITFRDITEGGHAPGPFGIDCWRRESLQAR